jgi:hypothetical protein
VRHAGIAVAEHDLDDLTGGQLHPLGGEFEVLRSDDQLRLDTTACDRASGEEGSDKDRSGHGTQGAHVCAPP